MTDPVLVVTIASHALTWECLDLLRLIPEPGDAERHHVARFEELRLRLHAKPYARRRAGDDDVARLHDEELRAIPDQVLDPEDHRLGVAALTPLAIDVEPHLEVLRILDLVPGHEPRPNRAEGLAALALVPLPARTVDLEGALGYVVRQEIPRDRTHRLVAIEIARALADHDAELDLVIKLGRFLRNERVVVRPADRGRRLVEDDRLLRDRHAGFGGVVGIVQSDRNEVAHIADAGPEPRLARHRFQLLQVSLLDLGEAAGCQHGAVDIRHHPRQVADFSVSIDNAGLLAAHWTITHEFHCESPTIVLNEYRLCERCRQLVDVESSPCPPTGDIASSKCFSKCRRLSPLQRCSPVRDTMNL